MKKMVMALAIATSSVLTGCAVSPVHMPGVVVSKEIIPSHRKLVQNTSAYNGQVYAGSSYWINVPAQYVLHIKTNDGMMDSVVSEYEFVRTPVGKRLTVETNKPVWAWEKKN